jgi:hypothetical protein
MGDPKDPATGRPPKDEAEPKDRQPAEPELSEEDLAFIREAEQRFAERYTRPKVSKTMQEKMQSGVSDLKD